jgi:hypothetical protein
MWLGRVLRGLVALLTACLPAVLLWLLIVATIDHREAVRASTTASPNPAKAPAWWVLGLLDVLVYADPYLEGRIQLWLLPGAGLLLGLALWAAGLPVVTKESAAGWPMPRFVKVIGVALAVGAFLAIPWLYAWIRVLSEPML